MKIDGMDPNAPFLKIIDVMGQHLDFCCGFDSEAGSIDYIVNNGSYPLVDSIKGEMVKVTIALWYEVVDTRTGEVVAESSSPKLKTNNA